MKSLEKNQDLAKEGNLLKQLLDHERYLRVASLFNIREKV